MFASNLDGRYIGERITWARLMSLGNGRFEPQWSVTEPITMILHKKNHRVLIRHGTNNRQLDLSPETPVMEVSNV